MRHAFERFVARRIAHVVSAALLLFAACSTDRILSESVGGDEQAMLPDVEPHAPRTLRVLKLDTYDGSGQTVHPDFAQSPLWTNPMLLVVTPYSGGGEGLENPSLFARGKDFEWSPVSKRASPLARPSAGHLSDPDIVAIPGSRDVWIYYRQVDKLNRILLVRTKDGQDFTAPIEVVSGPNHSIVSPAVVRRDSTRWRMWSVNAGPEGCRAVSTVVELRWSMNGMTWSKPKVVGLGRPGSFVWHLDVQWIPSRHEYWALFNSKVAGTCATRVLYLATSPDGITWHTYPSPVIVAGVIPEFQDMVYRSTFAYDPTSDVVRFWYSGARADDKKGLVWQTAFDRRDREELFASISGAAKVIAIPAGSIARSARFDPP